MQQDLTSPLMAVCTWGKLLPGFTLLRSVQQYYGALAAVR
ncbi:hypothetical protein BH11PSE12_BH11PSE12_19140 [soil metagenome]